MNLTQKLRTLLDNFNRVDRFVLQKEGENKAFLEQKKQLESHVISKKDEIILCEKVSLLVQKLTELSRKETLEKIATIVTKALQDVKDPTLEFKINYKMERNQSIAEFAILDNKLKTELDIFDSCGGTIADLVEFALKISLLLKWQPQLSKILILDESFKFVSIQDRYKLGKFIQELSNKLGIQIILISHSQELIEFADKVYRVEHDGTQSLVIPEV
jgi:DNA repair exonuclease SbcCD ATPase subunit